MASRNRRNAGRPGLLRRATGAAGRGLGRVLGLAGLPLLAVFIYTAGVWCLWQYAARSAVRPADPQTDAASCPWLDPSAVAELNGAVHLGPGTTLYDRAVCGQVAARYADNPWISEVVAVRREFPDRIVVDLAVRQPFAYVRSPAGYYLVDSAGYRLPVRPAAGPEAELPVIQGVRSAPPDVGRRWNGRPLTDCLRLAGLLGEVLEGRGAGMRLACVEVLEEKGSVDNLPQLAASTASGLMIDWGSFTETSTYLFPSADEKRRQLLLALEDIRNPASVEAIMVRYKVYSTRPRAGWSNATGTGGAGTWARNR